MFIKFVSLTIAMCVGELFILGLQAPNDSMFLFISNSPLIVLAHLTLAITLLILAFRGRFLYRQSRIIAQWAGIILITFGVAGMISETIFDLLGQFLKTVDYILMTEAGIVFVLASLTYRTGRRELPLRKLALQKLPRSLNTKLPQQKV
jgi:amino acid transporter